MIDELHMLHMGRALALAGRGRGRTTPNPMVGAVIVDAEGVVVGRGAHLQAGGPHAEVYALNEAGPRARGAILYCTLEPCCHVGKTGPCAPRLVAAGISRAVIAMEDPNPLVAGKGISILREHGIEVSVGAMACEAERLNPGFLTRVRKGRPFVTMKTAVTLDGCVSAAPGTRSGLTGAAANRFVHRERAEIDGLAVGSGTLLTDDPLLTPRGPYRYRPLVRVIFDRRLRTPATARVLSTRSAGPVIIMSTPSAADASPHRVSALAAGGAAIERIEDEPGRPALFLSRALSRLAALDCNSVVVEGGPTLHRALWDARLVDRIEMFVTPQVAGRDGVPWDVVPIGTLGRLQDSRVHILGDDILIEGYVHRAD